MAKKIFQIQIALAGSKPKIWRRLLIPSDLLLSDLHKVIQTSMGWTNSHLHQFIKHGISYTRKYPDDDMWEEWGSEDYKKMKISDLLSSEKDKIKYEYDFGDGWEHTLLLEKIIPVDENQKYPFCLTGKMSCPPEDCGGIWGYLNMVEILKQPKHEEYKSYIQWLGGKFDPERFDLEKVNKKLGVKDFGCIEL